MKNHVKVKFISENLFHSHDLLLNLKIGKLSFFAHIHFILHFDSGYVAVIVVLLAPSIFYCSKILRTLQQSG